MKKFLAVVSLFFKSYYSIPAIKGPDNKISAKSILKIFGIVVLFAYILASFGFLAWQVYYNMYKIFSSIGLQKLMLVYALLYGSVFVAVISFITSISTVYTNEMEAYVATLPIKPAHILSGKAAAITIPEFFFSVLVMGSGFFIYGIFEHAPALFYVNCILIMLAVTIIAVAIGYILGIPLLSISKLFRNRDRSMIIIGFATMGFVLFFNATTNRVMSATSNPEQFMKLMQGSNDNFLRLLDTIPPLRFVLNSLLDPGNPVFLVGLVSILALALFIAYGLFSLLAPLYQNVIRSFSENFIKKLNKEQTAALVNKETKTRGKLTALVLREWRGMNREPIYFLNGPFIIVLMPLIMGISIFFSLEKRGNLNELTTLIQNTLSPANRILITCLAAAFLGSATSITCTALSRDAKHLSYMKSLPIKTSMYMGAKLVHGSIFGILGTLMSLLIGIFLLKLDFPQAVLAFLIGMALAELLNILGLYIDTLNPQLRWENPVAALKQNINAVIAILFEMAVAGLLGYIGFTKIKSTVELAVFFGIIPAVLCVVLLAAYFPFAYKKIRRLEA